MNILPLFWKGLQNYTTRTCPQNFIRAILPFAYEFEFIHSGYQLLSVVCNKITSRYPMKLGKSSLYVLDLIHKRSSKYKARLLNWCAEINDKFARKVSLYNFQGYSSLDIRGQHSLFIGDFIVKTRNTAAAIRVGGNQSGHKCSPACTSLLEKKCCANHRHGFLAT